MTLHDDLVTTPSGAAGAPADDGGAIVVGIDASEIGGDGSKPSMRAAVYAAGLARLQGSRLVAVWVRPRMALSDTFVETSDEIVHDSDDVAAGMGAAFDRLGDRFGIRTRALVVRNGDPFDGLTGVADELHAGTIVVGASTHRIGSLTARLVRDAHCPVTVVP